MRWTARDLRSLGIGLAYLAPSLVLFAAFVFIPLAETINLSLFNTRATGAITTFAGLDHYLELLTSPAFRTGLLATAIFASGRAARRSVKTGRQSASVASKRSIRPCRVASASSSR